MSNRNSLPAKYEFILEKVEQGSEHEAFQVRQYAVYGDGDRELIEVIVSKSRRHFLSFRFAVLDQYGRLMSSASQPLPRRMRNGETRIVKVQFCNEIKCSKHFHSVVTSTRATQKTTACPYCSRRAKVSSNMLIGSEIISLEPVTSPVEWRKVS